MKFIFFLFLTCGCASTPQVDFLVSNSEDLPSSHEIKNVPYFEQTENYCGPAALASVAAFSGLSIGIGDLAPMMITPAKKGTLQLDFIGAARRLGLVVLPSTQLKSVLTEVAAENPVVVLQNFGSSANPIWHYSVVYAYDLKRKELLLRSGNKKEWVMSLDQFERAWSKADYWAVIVIAPRILSVTSSLTQYLIAATALERLRKLDAARAAYETIVMKWPDDSVAFFGLGNVYAQLSQWRNAETAFEVASRLDPKSGAIWNNLSEVYQKRHKPRQAAKAKANASRFLEVTQ